MTQERIGLLLLRFGLVAVYVYFGISQLIDAGSWTGLIPVWASSLSGLSALTVVYANGVFELVFAGLLALGLWVRPVSFILALHLAVITYIVGFNSVGARDFGLTLATLSHGLLGERR